MRRVRSIGSVPSLVVVKDRFLLIIVKPFIGWYVSNFFRIGACQRSGSRLKLASRVEITRQEYFNYLIFFDTNISYNQPLDTKAGLGPVNPVKRRTAVALIVKRMVTSLTLSRSPHVVPNLPTFGIPISHVSSTDSKTAGSSRY